jgi:hypothetical protein
VHCFKLYADVMVKLYSFVIQKFSGTSDEAECQKIFRKSQSGSFYTAIQVVVLSCQGGCKFRVCQCVTSCVQSVCIHYKFSFYRMRRDAL